jgi:hypothetical protein
VITDSDLLVPDVECVPGERVDIDDGPQRGNAHPSWNRDVHAVRDRVSEIVAGRGGQHAQGGAGRSIRELKKVGVGACRIRSAIQTAAYSLNDPHIFSRRRAVPQRCLRPVLRYR